MQGLVHGLATYCNQKEYGHLLTVYQRRWDVADLVECLLSVYFKWGKDKQIWSQWIIRISRCIQMYNRCIRDVLKNWKMKRNVSYIFGRQRHSNRNQLVERIKYQRLSYVLDFGFNIFDCVRRFDVEGDGFTSKCFYEDLHCCV